MMKNKKHSTKKQAYKETVYFWSDYNMQNIQDFRSQLQSKNISIFKVYEFQGTNWAEEIKQIF